MTASMEQMKALYDALPQMSKLATALIFSGDEDSEALDDAQDDLASSMQQNTEALLACAERCRQMDEGGAWPKPDDEDQAGGWKIDAKFLIAVKEHCEDVIGESVEMEQAEAVLLAASALRSHPPAGQQESAAEES